MSGRLLLLLWMGGGGGRRGRAVIEALSLPYPDWTQIRYLINFRSLCLLSHNTTSYANIHSFFFLLGRFSNKSSEGNYDAAKLQD